MDFAMQFEGVITKYFGAAEDQTYYANYYQNDFSRQALLYAICIKERNANTSKQTDENLKLLDGYIGKLSTHNALQDDIIGCIAFLLAK